MTSLTAPTGRDARIIGLLCVPHTLSHFYYVAVTVMFPTLMVVFDLKALQVGMIMTAFAMTAMVSQTPVGFLVDRIGGRHILAAGLVIEGGAIASMGFAEAHWHLVLLGAVGGLGHTVFHPADYAIMSSVVSERRMGRAFSFHSFSGYIGFAVAPTFMIEVKNAFGWQSSFFLAGSMAIAAAALIWFNAALLDGGSGSDRQSRQDRSPGDSDRFARGLRLLLSVPVLMCFLYFIFHQLGSGGVRTFLMVALDGLYQTPERVASTALTCFMVGAAGGILSGGVVADRFGPRATTAFLTLVPAGFLISSIGFFEFPAAALFVVLAMSGLLVGLLMPSRDLLLRSVTPPGSMGKVMGFASTGANFGGAMIPVIVGYCMDAWGQQWVFWISALFIGGACVTFVSVSGKFARSHPEPSGNDREN